MKGYSINRPKSYAKAHALFNQLHNHKSSSRGSSVLHPLQSSISYNKAATNAPIPTTPAATTFVGAAPFELLEAAEPVAEPDMLAAPLPLAEEAPFCALLDLLAAADSTMVVELPTLAVKDVTVEDTFMVKV